MEYELKLERFSGPIEKLLELIEEKKLEITELNLAEVTGDFLKHIKTLNNTETSPRLLADFTVVASCLALIKSKALIPSFELIEEEKEDIKDLENRLRIYKEIRSVKNYIKELYDSNRRLMSREFFSRVSPVFYPPPKITAADFRVFLDKTLAVLDEFRKAESFKVAVVSIEKKVKEILARLKNFRHFSFLNHTSEKSKAEIVALFLAILHLLKEGTVKVKQDEHFSDIIISN